MSSPSEHPDATPAPRRHPRHRLPAVRRTAPRASGAVAWAFFVTGLRNCFGLGRSGRSKILPMVLLGLMLLPALILVGVLVQAKDLLGLDEHIVPYSIYPLTTQLLISVFVAAQAPALISRDLRFRTITLYLARPGPPDDVRPGPARVADGRDVRADRRPAPADVRRWAARRPAARPRDRALPRGDWSARCCWRPAWPRLAALVSALTIRRGLAVAAVIVVLLVSYTVVSTIQGIAFETGHETVGRGRRGLLAVHPGQRGAGLPLRLARGPRRRRRQ